MDWPAGSVGEYLDYLGPGLTAGPCPPWPPDVFALTASVLRRTGAYVRAQESSQTGRPPLLERGWHEQARRLAEAWRTAVSTALQRPDSPLLLKEARKRLKAVALPAEVQDWWRQAIDGGSLLLSMLAGDDETCGALLKMCLVADEACKGMGIEEWKQDEDFILGHVEYPVFAHTAWASLCVEVQPHKVRVLPKQHTSQRGSTVRSLSHYLALCPANEVDISWSSPARLSLSRDLEALNLLLLPWPLEMPASCFALSTDKTAPPLPDSQRFFDFLPGLRKTDFKLYLEEALNQAKEHVSEVHGIVFPELALTWEEYEHAESIAVREEALLIAGVALPGVPATNACLVQWGGMTSAKNRILEYTRVQQTKHHRWCLDRDQILRYGLGGRLPASKECWEHIDIRERRVHFATLGSWMTLSVLICEDLARQDPVSEILRAVGPNLVVALLMDGPQVRSRWPNQYAMVLADDPGSSVLTLTSLGMSLRSEPPPGQPDRSRVIALWRDVIYRERELELDKDCQAAVLSLVCSQREEFTADGRSDGRQAEFPVFAGFRSLKLNLTTDKQ